MSEYMFGVRVQDGRTAGVERDRRDAVAAKHGCCWVEIYDQGSGKWKSWFAGPNRGYPLNERMEEAVLRDLLQKVEVT